MLVDAYVHDEREAGDAQVQRIESVLASFPLQPPPGCDAEAPVAEAARVGAAAIRWARKQVCSTPSQARQCAACMLAMHGMHEQCMRTAAVVAACCACTHAQGNGRACRRFHRALACHAAAALPGARGLAAATEHFARCGDMPAFASALREAVAVEGAEADLDLFTARAVLQVPPTCTACSLCSSALPACSGLLVGQCMAGQVVAASRREEQPDWPGTCTCASCCRP